MSSPFNFAPQQASFPCGGRGQYDIFDDSSKGSSPNPLSPGVQPIENWDATGEPSPSSTLGNRAPINMLSDYSRLSRSDKSVRRPKSLAPKIDLLDSPLGIGTNLDCFSDYQGCRQRGYSDDTSGPLFTPSRIHGGQYDFFDDVEDKTPVEFDTGSDYCHLHSLSRETSPLREKSNSSFPFVYSRLQNEQIYEDLFKWVWGVIYKVNVISIPHKKNDGFMNIAVLAELLYNASSEWYEIIESEFCGLYNFLQKYPLDFFISRENGVYCVSLKPGDHATHNRIRSRSAGQSCPSDLLSFDSGEYQIEPSRTNVRVSRGTPITEGLISQVIEYICDVLRKSPNFKQKAVELGNRVRDTFGTELLSGIREKYQGLLNMLEEYPQYFVVTRIPKNDFVSLSPEASMKLFDENRFLYPEGVNRFSSGVRNMDQACKLTTTSRCLHVGNVGLRASEESLRNEFGQYGEIEDVKIVHQGERRYAFVYFVTREEAEYARNSLIKQPKWKGNISFAKKEKDASERRSKLNQPSRHLWLGNINTRTVTVNELRKLFESFGQIENINVLYEKNCVFIDYFEEASAVAAQRCMQGVTIHGNILDLGFGKCDRPNIVSMVQLTSDDVETLLSCFTTIMSTLHSREQISLTDMYYRIVTSDDFKRYCASCFSKPRESEEKEVSSTSDTVVHQNVEFLRSVLLSVSTVYIIQEDVISHELFFSNNLLPGKSTQDEKMCIDVLKDILLSERRLVVWPKCQQRDMYLINLTKQLVLQSSDGVSIQKVATSIQVNLFYSAESINVPALEAFFTAYGSLFAYENGNVSSKN